MTLDAQAPGPLPPASGGGPAGPPLDAAVVVLPAEIDFSNSDQIAGALRRSLREGPVVADLTATVFCDTSGTVALARAGREARLLGRDLRLAIRPDGQVARILQQTGCAPRLRLFASVREAAAAPPSLAVLREP